MGGRGDWQEGRQGGEAAEGPGEGDSPPYVPPPVSGGAAGCGASSGNCPSRA